MTLYTYIPMHGFEVITSELSFLHAQNSLSFFLLFYNSIATLGLNTNSCMRGCCSTLTFAASCTPLRPSAATNLESTGLDRRWWTCGKCGGRVRELRVSSAGSKGVECKK